jgi:exopolysaccharide biosynthesis polyprenyl glycosylphosphotransferase
MASAQKRVFDLVVGGLALVALSPILIACAVAIRLEGPGPILFRQTRYGINLVGFRIFKFRTMRTMEDGRVVRQATRDDPRITRVGRVLRRWNLDELPQLLNVVEGTMSLVGPRPHAMAHDQAFSTTLAEYTRRHNAKPGITGWAQVNGFRGEIADEAALRGRLTHDLYYLDNWSLWFDICIIALTVVSPKAYRNAR